MGGLAFWDGKTWAMSNPRWVLLPPAFLLQRFPQNSRSPSWFQLRPSPFFPLHRTHHRHNDVRRRPHLNGPAERESRSCLVWSPLHSRRNHQVSWVFPHCSLYLFSALIPPGPWALCDSQRHSLVPCAHTPEQQSTTTRLHDSLTLSLCYSSRLRLFFSASALPYTSSPALDNSLRVPLPPPVTGHLQASSPASPAVGPRQVHGGRYSTQPGRQHSGVATLSRKSHTTTHAPRHTHHTTTHLTLGWARLSPPAVDSLPCYLQPCLRP